MGHSVVICRYSVIVLDAIWKLCVCVRVELATIASFCLFGFAISYAATVLHDKWMMMMIGSFLISKKLLRLRVLHVSPNLNLINGKIVC